MLQTVATRPLARHAPNYSPAEIGLSGLGGLLGMALTLWLSTWLLGADVAVTVLASMGASAVLLFAIPHSAFSSPWAVLGGHGVSACIGVACAELVALLLLGVALLFNGVLRAGQAAHVAEVEAQAALPPEVLMIKHDDLMYALGEIRSFIDVSEDDLMHIYRLALQHAIHPEPALDSPARS
ncbi:HPP family protein [mine drainage metagenome]|uniref:HPP family protein n=1 Tax=mine drainage metagenome TaxID=410659 RepID=A0A1J5RXS1_9ZZZZ